MQACVLKCSLVAGWGCSAYVLNRARQARLAEVEQRESKAVKAEALEEVGDDLIQEVLDAEVADAAKQFIGAKEEVKHEELEQLTSMLNEFDAEAVATDGAEVKVL